MWVMDSPRGEKDRMRGFFVTVSILAGNNIEY